MPVILVSMLFFLVLCQRGTFAMSERGVSEPLLLRPIEAASLAGVGRSTVYELMATEWRTFTISVGRSKRIARVGLEAWIAGKLQEKAASVGGSRYY